MVMVGQEVLDLGSKASPRDFSIISSLNWSSLTFLALSATGIDSVHDRQHLNPGEPGMPEWFLSHMGGDEDAESTI